MRDKGLLTGKVDLRKAPTRAQRNAIEKFKDVVSGKATVVKTPKAKALGDLYQRKGSAVIVPKKSGEKVTTDKAGNVVITAKRGKRSTRRVIDPDRKPEAVKEKRGNIHALPFKTKAGKIYWMRFGTKSEMVNFVQRYKKSEKEADEWLKFAVTEYIADRDERDDMLAAENQFSEDSGLEEKLGGARRVKRFKRRRRSR